MPPIQRAEGPSCLPVGPNSPLPRVYKPRASAAIHQSAASDVTCSRQTFLRRTPVIFRHLCANTEELQDTKNCQCLNQTQAGNAAREKTFKVEQRTNQDKPPGVYLKKRKSCSFFHFIHSFIYSQSVHLTLIEKKISTFKYNNINKYNHHRYEQ